MVERRHHPTRTRPDYLPAEVSIDELEDGLGIDEDALEEACIVQPELYYRAAKQLAVRKSKRDAAKQALEEAEATADGQARHDAEVAGEKVREAEIDSHKTLNPEVQRARRELLQLDFDVAQFDALKEAYQQRGYALKALIELHVTGYFGDPANMSPRAKNEKAQRARSVVAEMRRRSNSN